MAFGNWIASFVKSKKGSMVATWCLGIIIFLDDYLNALTISYLFSQVASQSTVIEDISFQTKAFSFNASIESERAGEHGKGFSVVSDEIGNLANSTTSSVKEIKSIVVGNTEKVNSIIETLNQIITDMVRETKEKVNLGNNYSEDSVVALDKIYSNSTELKNELNEIKNVIKEQNIAVGEIERSMSDINSISGENNLVAVQIDSNVGRLGKNINVLQAVSKELEFMIHAGSINKKINEKPNKSGKSLVSNVRDLFSKSKKNQPETKIDSDLDQAS